MKTIRKCIDYCVRAHYQSDMPLPFTALLLATVARYFHMVGHKSRTGTIDTLGSGSIP